MNTDAKILNKLSVNIIHKTWHNVSQGILFYSMSSKTNSALSTSAINNIKPLVLASLLLLL